MLAIGLHLEAVAAATTAAVPGIVSCSHPSLPRQDFAHSRALGSASAAATSAEDSADLSSAESAEASVELLEPELHPEATSLSSYRQAKLDVVELLVASPTAVVSSVVKSSADADDSLSYPSQTYLAAAVSPEEELKVEFADEGRLLSVFSRQNAGLMVACTAIDIDQALESP